MRVKSYIKDKLIDFILFSAFLVFSSMLLILMGVQTYAVIFLNALLLLIVIFVYIKDFFKRYQFYHNIEKSIDQLDKEYLISEMIDYPEFLDGDYLVDFMKSSNKSMCDEIAKYRLSSKEYKEYIEMWIHEVKTPMAAAELILLNHPSEENESLNEELSKVNNYLEQALYYARSSSLEKDYLIRKVNLGDVVNASLRKDAKVFIRNKVKLMKEDLNINVYCDPKWIDFILTQIFNNAIKYKDNNSEIRIWKEERENSTSLYIRDNGIGIPMKDLSRVKEKGYTGENGRKFNKSTGIGLYLCNSLCSKMGMNLKVDSKEGEYTEVEIVFPTNKSYFML